MIKAARLSDDIHYALLGEFGRDLGSHPKLDVGRKGRGLIIESLYCMPPLLLSELIALLYPLSDQGRVARCSYPSSDSGLNPLNSHLGNLRDPS